MTGGHAQKVAAIMAESLNYPLSIILKRKTENPKPIILFPRSLLTKVIHPETEKFL
jgi:hypothetical protein